MLTWTNWVSSRPAGFFDLRSFGLPSTCPERVAQHRDPPRLSLRAQRDEPMKSNVRRVFDANFKAYDVRKV